MQNILATAATGSEFTMDDGRRTVIVLPNEEEVLETIAVGNPRATGWVMFWGRTYQGWYKNGSRGPLPIQEVDRS